MENHETYENRRERQREVQKLTLAVLAMLIALIAAPTETKQFFSQASRYIDSWVQAMVKMVKESGELVKNVMQQNKSEPKSDSESEKSSL